MILLDKVSKLIGDAVVGLRCFVNAVNSDNV